jgi:rhodanese-related sulfurtransferase
MTTTPKKLICLAITAAFLILAPSSVVFGEKVTLITKEELKPIMGNADVAIIDVRRGRDWTSSEFKIKGAVYGDPKKIAEWNKQFSKDTKLVLYCA